MTCRSCSEVFLTHNCRSTAAHSSQFLRQYQPYGNRTLRTFSNFGRKYCRPELWRVTETTADIVCIICKDGSSSKPNEIVLCDKCGVGYHQKCHQPFIEDNALEPDAPWMCVYCSNGIECPYLLNPFEVKLRNFNPSSRKHRAVTKDNHYSPDQKTDFEHNDRTERVRSVMGDYYDSSYPGNRMETSRSRARHVLGDHRVMSRRGVVDSARRLGTSPRNEFYPYPESYGGSSERLHYRQMEPLSKRRRIAEHQERITQDVWDNGYTSPHDGTRGSERVDSNKAKIPGKDGPREKQRLTQDLERQRKKLKEDMERGQELRREHNQLLTRDLPRSKSEDATTDDDRKDLDTKEPGTHDIRLYACNHEWNAAYPGENSSEGLENSREKVESAVSSKNNNTPPEDSGLNENCVTQKSLNSGIIELRVNHHENKDSVEQLDACSCDGEETQEETNSSQGGSKIKDVCGLIEEISDTQCQHSSSRDAECDRNTNELSPGSFLPSGFAVELNEESTDGADKNSSNKKVFTSEKVEVIGRSDDLTGYHEEMNKERLGRGRPKKNSHGKSGHRAHKRSSGGKTNSENDQDGCESKTSFHESKPRKTKEGSSGRSGSCKTDKESFKESTGSSSIEQQGTSHNDNETLDADEGGSKERGKQPRPHSGTHEGGSKKDRDVEVQNVIAQNRVRSDLPRHNWLLERLVNENKLPSSTCGSSGVGGKSTKMTSDDVLNDPEGEVTLSTKHENPEVSTTNPVSEDKHEEELIHSEAYAKTKPEQDTLLNEHSADFDNEFTKDEKTVERNSNDAGSPTFKLLSPVKSERNSPQRLNNLSPELKKFSPTLVPSSPCEVSEELDKSSLLLQVSDISRNTAEDKRSRGDSRDENKLSEENKDFSLAHTERTGEDIRFQKIKGGQDSDDNNLEIVVDERPLSGTQGKTEERVIEIKSDGEGNDEIKHNNEENSKETEVSKISTSKSVNPVSPFLRSERRSIEEMKAGLHESRRHGMVPRSPRIPNDLLTPLRFGNPGYLPGYSPRTFTPHLITHNIPSAPGVSAPVSPIVRHPAHSSVQGHLPGRMELGGHSKPDMNCPFHGKKATEKTIHHQATSYPISHGDHHVLGRVPLHDGLTEVAAIKMRDKLREHVEFASDPLAMHRRLPAIYDDHRHLMLPHGMPHGMHYGHVQHPRYLGPRIIHEPGFQLERERFKRRIDTGYTLYRPPIHAHSGPSEEHPSTYVASPSEDKRDEPKRIASPSAEHRHCPKHVPPSGDTGSESTRPVRSLPGASQYHMEHHRDKLTTSRLSPHEVKYLKADEPAHSEKSSPAKPGKHSPSDEKHVSHTAPSKEHCSDFIQLGDTKRLEGKSETDQSLLQSSQPSSTLDQESIRRDFNERFNILNKTFREKMEEVNPGEVKQQQKESLMSHESNLTSTYRRPGNERCHEDTPAFATGHPDDGITRQGQSPLSRGPQLSKYKPQERSGSPTGRNSSSRLSLSGRDERRKDEDVESARGLGTIHKPTLPTSSYPPYGDIMNPMAGPHRLHGYQQREEMKKAMMRGLPHITSHAEYSAHYNHMPWPVRSPGRVSTYTAPRINLEEIQKSAMGKHEGERSEYVSSKRELQEKEMSLALEKHRMNLANLENERRKAIERSAHPRLPTRTDDRRDERTRAENAELEQRSPRTREEALRRDWEEMEGRKRKFEDMSPDILSAYGRPPGSDMVKRLKIYPKDEQGHHHSNEVPTKEHYLAMYGTPRADRRVPAGPFPGRARSADNTPFYMSRFDLLRTKHERSVSEALRKQRMFGEEQAALHKLSSSNEKDTASTEPVKKRTKSQRMCGVCGEEPSFLCSGCQKAWYCGTKCQLKAWQEHSKECSEAKRR